MSISAVNIGPEDAGARGGMFSVSVVVPTYRRPAVMTQCVRSLLQGSLRPEEIIVAGRQGDTETELAVEALAKSTRFVRAIWVTIPGHLPPVEAGIRAASSYIIAIVDDDVTVKEDWLEKIIPHFSDSTVGVVGGPMLPPGGPPPIKGHPGRISWYGKAWGNISSLGGEIPRQVDNLMEGNWSWRRELLASLCFDPILNFDEASMYGTDLCFQARQRGFRVLYEPRAVVFHRVAPRTPELDRADRPRRIYCYCRNYTYIMLKWLPWWRKPFFLGWWFLVGERRALGLAAVAVEMLDNRGRLKDPLAPAFNGKMRGIGLWLGSRKLQRDGLSHDVWK